MSVLVGLWMLTVTSSNCSTIFEQLPSLPANCSALLEKVILFNSTYYFSVWSVDAYRHFQQLVSYY